MPRCSMFVVFILIFSLACENQKEPGYLEGIHLQEFRVGKIKKSFVKLKQRCGNSKVEQAIQITHNQISNYTNQTNGRHNQTFSNLVQNYIDEFEAINPQKGLSKEYCAKAETISKRYTKLFDLAVKNEKSEVSYNIGYSSDELEAVQQVFRDLGELIISKETLQHDHKLQVQTIPWAGYWYPYDNIQTLIRSGGPLDKFDSLLVTRGLASGARAYEADSVQNFKPDAWEGHCHAWAVASIRFPEPTEAIKLDGIFFSVSDIKALYTKAAEATRFKRYGIQYLGNHETDGTFQDIRPEAFHKILTTYLGNQKPVIVDDDPAVEVWSKPAFGYRYRKTKVTDDYLEFEAYVAVVRHRDQIFDKVTTPEDVVWRKYEFRLYFQYENEKQNTFQIIRGEWIGESVSNHPDSVLVDADEPIESYNPILNEHTELIQNLVPTRNALLSQRR